MTPLKKCANTSTLFMLESVDGRPHLEQAKPVIKARRPLYIDKPMAGSLKDALEIFPSGEASRRAGVQCLVTPLRQDDSGRPARFHWQSPACGNLQPLSPGKNPSRPFLVRHSRRRIAFHRDGHGLRQRQARHDQRRTDRGHRNWKGGRLGVYRENPKGYDGTAKGEKGESTVGTYDGYHPLVAEAVKFFRTGIAPVPPEETIEILAFMEAADESKRQGGAEVKIADVLKKALAR